jgi:hypothetical protein
MRLQRLVAGVLGAALLGAVPMALTTTSAQAGTTGPASTVNGKYFDAPDGNNVWRFGQAVKFEADVMIECTPGAADFTCRPADEPGDSVTLQRKMAGSTTWKTVSTRYDANAKVSFSVKSAGTAVYRILYSGGTSAAIQPSDSGASPSLKGSRNPRGMAALTRSGAVYRGNVDPGWARKPITIQRKACAADRCPWRAYKTVRTTRTGGYSVKISVPRSGRLYWRSTVKATSPTFVRGYGVPYYTTRSRVPARVGFGH